MTVPSAHLRVDTTGSTVTIRVRGEIDLFDADSLQTALEEAIPNEMTRVRLDLGGVTYIDSIGMRLLFGLASRLQVAQIEFVVVAPLGSPARRVITLSGLTATVALEPS